MDLSKLRITVIELNPWNEPHDFIPQLAKTIATEPYPRHIRELRAIDLRPQLDSEAWYVLDTHLNAEGHRRVARALADVLSPPAEAR